MDYREIPEDFEKAFDAFISVEMLEVLLLPSLVVPTASDIKKARRCQVLRPLLQTRRFCSQIQERYGRRHLVYLSRIEILKLSVSVPETHQLIHLSSLLLTIDFLQSRGFHA
jgi:hypothetical protein